MKAVDYFLENSGTKLEGRTPVKLLIDFSNEMNAVMKARHISLDISVMSLVDEFNQKWNKLCRLYVKEYGFSIIKEDGYKKYWKAAFAFSKMEVKNG